MNYRKIGEIRKSPLECHSNNFHRQESPVDTEISEEKFKQKQEYLHSLKVSAPKYFSNSKGKWVSLQWTIPADTSLTKQSRLILLLLHINIYFLL